MTKPTEAERTKAAELYRNQFPRNNWQTAYEVIDCIAQALADAREAAYKRAIKTARSRYEDMYNKSCPYCNGRDLGVVCELEKLVSDETQDENKKQETK